MAECGVSVFVPVYNEERIVESSVRSVQSRIAGLFSEYEIVIVDDGSTDNTPAVCEKLALQNAHFRHVYFENGPSRRENLGLAMKSAVFDVVCFMDVDLATDLSYLNELVERVKQGADIAIGSRYKGLHPERTWFRRCVSHLYNKFLKLYFGSRLCDHQCGFKAFRKSELIRLLDELGYDRSLSRGWFWDAELLIRAQRKGLKIVEFPVVWRFGEKSSFQILREMKMVPYVLALRWKL